MGNMKEDVVEMKRLVEEAQKEEHTLAMELIHDQRVYNKRMFKCWLITFIVMSILLATSIGYIIYLLNDITYEEVVEVTQENTDGYNNYVGNDGDIINGETSN